MLAKFISPPSLVLILSIIASTFIIIKAKNTPPKNIIRNGLVPVVTTSTILSITTCIFGPCSGGFNRMTFNLHAFYKQHLMSNFFISITTLSILEFNIFTYLLLVAMIFLNFIGKFYRIDNYKVFGLRKPLH